MVPGESGSFTKALERSTLKSNRNSTVNEILVEKATLNYGANRQTDSFNT